MENKLSCQTFITLLVFTFSSSINNLYAQAKNYEYIENHIEEIKITTTSDGHKTINKENKDGSSSIYSIEKQNYENTSSVYEYNKSGDKKKIGEIERKEIGKIENQEFTSDSASSMNKTGLDKTTEGNYWRYIYKDGKKVYIEFYKKNFIAMIMRFISVTLMAVEH